MSGRTIVVGDIHGCYDELVDLLQRINFGKQDRLVAVGDLIVKGEQSREVLELFSTNAQFSSVIGNHDLALLRYWRGESDSLNGAQKKTRRELKSDQDRYAAYLSSLPYSIKLDSHLVVHAGVRPGVPLESQSPYDLTELRTLGRKRTSRKGTPWYEVYDGDLTVLFGHWPAKEPRRAPHAIGLDTGCVYGNRLTAYIIETGELVSVAARRAHHPPKRALK